MPKIDYTSLLTKRYSLIISGYWRETLCKLIILVLQQLITQYIIEDTKLFKLFDQIKEYDEKYYENESYKITKCFTLEDYMKDLKLILLDPASLQIKICIAFNLDRLKYDLIYQNSSENSSYKYYIQNDCAFFKKGEGRKYRYPKPGEKIKIRINCWNNQTSKHQHILAIKIMDRAFIPLASASLGIKGKGIRDGALYLQWDSKKTKDTGYKNGLLLIETFSNRLQSSTNLKSQDYKHFPYDYVFHAH